MQLQIYKEIFSSPSHKAILTKARLFALRMPITYFDIHSGKFILLIDTGILLKVPTNQKKICPSCDFETDQLYENTYQKGKPPICIDCLEWFKQLNT